MEDGVVVGAVGEIVDVLDDLPREGTGQRPAAAARAFLARGPGLGWAERKTSNNQGSGAGHLDSIVLRHKLLIGMMFHV